MLGTKEYPTLTEKRLKLHDLNSAQYVYGGRKGVDQDMVSLSEVPKTRGRHRSGLIDYR